MNRHQRNKLNKKRKTKNLNNNNLTMEYRQSINSKKLNCFHPIMSKKQMRLLNLFKKKLLSTAIQHNRKKLPSKKKPLANLMKEMVLDMNIKNVENIKKDKEKDTKQKKRHKKLRNQRENKRNNYQRKISLDQLDLQTNNYN